MVWGYLHYIQAIVTRCASAFWLGDKPLRPSNNQPKKMVKKMRLSWCLKPFSYFLHCIQICSSLALDLVEISFDLIGTGPLVQALFYKNILKRCFTLLLQELAVAPPKHPRWEQETKPSREKKSLHCSHLRSSAATRLFEETCFSPVFLVGYFRGFTGYFRVF